MKKTISIMIMIFVVLSLGSAKVFSQNQQASPPAGQTALTFDDVQKVRLNEIIQRMAYMQCFDYCRPHTRWEKKHWPFAVLKGQFLLTNIDESGVVHGVQYSVLIYQNNKTGKIISFMCSTHQNGFWTDITYVPGENPVLVSYCLNEPTNNTLGLIPWDTDEFLCKFGGINGIYTEGEVHDIPNIIWVKEMNDHLPKNIMHHMEEISLDWGNSVKQIIPIM